ncbi:N-acetylmuramoyl-L-alanine amidase [Candidatus Bealeia paramacronuclearis]|uniref:N-acetylmuramoyl-L-alanine amidase n=1 Tax=Candidatus Bealeia paramacronuclearis TaxID=1921001 RepID=A0ABZ2C087_9PROT|nr:N-acetylmuramoyl-L-alanine amidase [Candidatus Bealeia paramacronuclearis]
MDLKSVYSPNFNERIAGSKIEWIIVHYTDTPSIAASLSILTNLEAQVSSHYLVDETGEIYQLVDEEKRAWHAGPDGASYWRGRKSLNSHSIGIEIQNPGHSHGYREFSKPQIEAVLNLCKDIQLRHKLGQDCLWGHSDISPQRKQDPGHLFPWKDFAKEGLGIWPEIDLGDLSGENEKEILQKIGYNPDFPNESIIAFQRHFRPNNFDGILDEETRYLMEVVVRQCEG